MRMVHVDSGRTWRGGQAQVGYLLEGLKARGDAVMLAAPRESPLAAKARALGIETIDFRPRGDLDVAASLGLARGVRRFGADLVSRWKYRHGVARYVAISNCVARNLEAGGVEPDRIRVVYSGVPVHDVPLALDPADRSAAQAVLGLGADEMVAGLVGAMTSQKGYDLAIAAGRLVRPEDAVELAAAMTDLAGSAAVRTELSGRARQRTRRYAVSEMVSGNVRVYDELRRS